MYACFGDYSQQSERYRYIVGVPDDFHSYSTGLQAKWLLVKAIWPLWFVFGLLLLLYIDVRTLRLSSPIYRMKLNVSSQDVVFSIRNHKDFNLLHMAIWYTANSELYLHCSMSFQKSLQYCWKVDLEFNVARDRFLYVTYSCFVFSRKLSKPQEKNLLGKPWRNMVTAQGKQKRKLWCDVEQLLLLSFPIFDFW